METRKTLKKSVISFVCVLMVACMLFLVACDDKGDDNLPSINITTSVDDGSIVTKGNKIQFLVAVSDNSPYEVSVDNEELAKLSGNTLVILKDATEDTEIKLTAKIKRLPNVSKTVTFKMTAPVQLPEIYMTSSKPENSRLEKGDKFTVNASSTDKSPVILSVSDKTLATISGNEITIIGEPAHDSTLVVTATLKDFESVTKSRTYYVKAPTVKGQVQGKDDNILTTELIEALGNKNITVNGVVTDVFFDAADGSTTNREYQTKVMMSEGKWYGEWFATPVGDEKATVITDSYKASESADYKDANGTIGHATQRVYINKDNKVATKVQTDSMSFPYIWENQHYWNHIGQFAKNVEKKFVYRPEEDVFEYVWKIVDSEGKEYVDDEYDYYLMTYLSYSFTPMLEDTLENLYFKMENGQITKILAKTAEETGTNMNRAYTTIEFTFEDIGETVVPDPAPYKHYVQNDALATALAKMKAATSYAFKTSEVATTTPTPDASDYTASISSASAAATTKFPAGGYSGTVGLAGKVTQDKVLLTRTGKYEYYSDDTAPYWFKYSGYYQIDESTYDYFEYNTTSKKLEGVNQYVGSLTELLPGWNLSADVFQFAGSQTDANNKTVTKYVLRNTQIIEEAAKEVCMHSDVNSTTASSQHAFTITVDSNGNVVSTSFPYAYSAYAGYCLTTYSKVNATDLFTDEFDGYQPRVLPEWEDLSTNAYYNLHTSDFKQYPCYNKKTGAFHDPSAGPCTHNVTLDVVIANVFKDNASAFPTMATFRRIFGDDINTPFFYEYDSEELADDTTVYTDYVKFTSVAPQKYLDEKNNLTNTGFNEMFAEIKSVMNSVGFTYNSGVSAVSGGLSGKADRKMVFSYGDKLTIVMTNNHTRYFWLSVYNFGDYNVG